MGVDVLENYCYRRILTSFSFFESTYMNVIFNCRLRMFKQQEGNFNILRTWHPYYMFSSSGSFQMEQSWGGILSPVILIQRTSQIRSDRPKNTLSSSMLSLPQIKIHWTPWDVLHPTKFQPQLRKNSKEIFIYYSTFFAGMHITWDI